MDGSDGKQISPALVQGYKLVKRGKKNLQGAFGRIYKIHNNIYLDPESLYVEMQAKPGMLRGSDCGGLRGKAKSTDLIQPTLRQSKETPEG